MPVDDPSSAAPSRAAEFRSAGIKVGGALIFFAILYGLYARQVKVEEQVQQLLAGPRTAGGQRAGGARAELNKDTPAGWLAAEAALKQALEMQPSNPYAVAAFADTEAMLATNGYPDRASVADDAIARAEAKDVAQPERYEARALRLIQQGKAADAETGLLAILARFGVVPRAVDALGLAKRAQGKLVEARMNFKKAQDADWRAPRKVANYANALLEDGSGAEALAAFDRALQANSEHLRSMIGKARAFVSLARAGRVADLKAAQGLCDQVLSRGADEVPPLLRAQALAARAEVKFYAGDTAGAAKDAADAKAQAPDSPEALRALAVTAKSGAYDLWMAAAAKDKYDASIYFDGAQSLSAAGDTGSAEKLLNAFAAQLPKTARYDLALAHLLLARGDTKGADAALTAAAGLEPANAMIYFEQGRSAQMRGDIKAATAAYEHAAQLRDDMPEIYRQMGVLYFQSKAIEDGLRAFTDALARYKAARAPASVMEPFYDQVFELTKQAGKVKIGKQWVEEARAAH